ncbi:MAG TPA: hypothetical protein VFU15_15115, partial [Bacteroidia bacterium]|nr:hypothetical protein [Bacteroidia bacterium]
MKIRLLLPLLLAFFLFSCGPKGAYNSYKDAKVHSSERIAKQQAKASKKAQKDFKKNLKKANKQGGKKGNRWSRKKK